MKSPQTTSLSSQIAQRLCALPLFMGMRQSDVLEILRTVRFGFHTYKPADIICREQQVNNRLLFLLNGNYQTIRHNEENHITFEEELSAPIMLGADILYGLTHTFSHTYKALTSIQCISVDKPEINAKLLSYPIFQLNLLNYLSLLEQRRQDYLYEPIPNSLRQRFSLYLKHNFTSPCGQKRVICKRMDLAKILVCNHKNIYKLLNELKAEHLIDTSRGNIFIPSLQMLQP